MHKEADIHAPGGIRTRNPQQASGCRPASLHAVHTRTHTVGYARTNVIDSRTSFVIASVETCIEG